MKQQALHRNVSDTLQHVVEGVMLSDWRTVTKEQIVQNVARLRTLKAQYVSTHFSHQLEMREEVLSPLDQALLALYLLLDTLEGRDLTQQRNIYLALLEAQTPLLLACSIVPAEEGEELEPVTERASQEEPLVPNLAATSLVEVSTSSEKEAASSKWFRWNQEREQQLNEAITQLVGGLDHLDQMSQAVMKQIAAQHDWPLRSIEYKVRQLRLRQASRGEGQREAAAAPEQEDDRRATLMSSH